MASPVSTRPVDGEPRGLQVEQPTSEIGLNVLSENWLGDGLDDSPAVGGEIDSRGPKSVQRQILALGLVDERAIPATAIGIVDIAEENADGDMAREVRQPGLVDALLLLGTLDDVRNEMRVGL